MPDRSQFPFPLDLRSIYDKDGYRVPRHAMVGSLFVFVSQVLGRVEVEVGFDTDFASVPRALWALFPPDAEYTEAAVIHDSEYWKQRYTREQADALLLEGMEALGVGWFTRHTIHSQVRMWGWMAWNANAKRKAAEGSPQIAPVETAPYIPKMPASPKFHKNRR